MNQLSKFCFVFGLLVLVSFLPQTGYGNQANRDPQLIIVGNVVGFDEIWSQVNLTCAPQRQTLVVRVQTCLHGTANSNYIKVLYEFMGSEQKLPDEMQKSEQAWQFKLYTAKAEPQIKVIQNPSGNQRESPASGEDWENMKNWQFQIIEPTPGQLPDGSIKMLRKTTGAEAETIPTTDLPCYELKPGDFQRLAR